MPTSLATLTIRLNNRLKVIDLCIRWPLKRVTYLKVIRGGI